tara:strand:- start:85 stop:522 length:438 start_codon:yes stop_codon:yes gene_type:complete
MIKSFRGLLADGEQDTISLHRNNGKTGYKVVKFEIMPSNAFGNDYNGTVTVFKESQTAALTTVNFSDNRLLAAGIWSSRSSAESYPEDVSIIFDNEIFNQDIYVLYQDTKGLAAGEGMNYYIELEQINLTLDESTVATLKDLRNS